MHSIDLEKVNLALKYKNSHNECWDKRRKEDPNSPLWRHYCDEEDYYNELTSQAVRDAKDDIILLALEHYKSYVDKTCEHYVNHYNYIKHHENNLINLLKNAESSSRETRKSKKLRNTKNTLLIFSIVFFALFYVFLISSISLLAFKQIVISIICLIPAMFLLIIAICFCVIVSKIKKRYEKEQPKELITIKDTGSSGQIYNIHDYRLNGVTKTDTANDIQELVI